jgi:hypothetical protein
MMEGSGPGTLPLVINAPANLAGGMLAVASTPSTGGTAAALPVPGITANVVRADPPLADVALNNAAAIAGNIALVDRGTVSFATKIRNCQNAGAIAVIVANNADTFPIMMGVDATIPPSEITIPAVMVGQADGAELAAAAGLNATISGETAAVMGEFQGGRGASDSLFGVLVPEPGVYAIRTTWKEGGGGANIEIFQVNADGTRTLINDSAEPDSLKAWRTVGGGGGGEIRITDVQRNSTTGELTITFTSEPGNTYRSDWSLTMADGSWQEANDNIPASGGATTVTTVTTAQTPGATDEVFVRIVEL